MGRDLESYNKRQQLILEMVRPAANMRWLMRNYLP